MTKPTPPPMRTGREPMIDAKISGFFILVGGLLALFGAIAAASNSRPSLGEHGVELRLQCGSSISWKRCRQMSDIARKAIEGAP